VDLDADDRRHVLFYRFAAEPLVACWRAGLETFLIGITAAFVAYLVGVILSGLVSGAG
jgi:hypothetical protein